MAAADAGQHDGSLSSDLERALICERLKWRILPHELDEVDVEALRGPLEELVAYRTAQKYARDLDSMSDEELEFMAWIEQMRRL